MSNNEQSVLKLGLDTGGTHSRNLATASRTYRPGTCYHEMRFYLDCHEYELARERALALQEWLDKGGFHPPYAKREQVAAWLANVLHKTRNFGRE